jgi:UDP-N-acetylglucosamine 4,6-dehydratase/5-epimerase
MEMKDMFKGKTILITGGTGFLGKALTREILKSEPHAIRIFSRDEVKHYLFQEEFGHDPRLRSLVGDVRDLQRLRRAVRGCDLVIHAAALKRLDLLEYNTDEAIKTNILGTMNVVTACLESSIPKMVYISTDKACMPVNTYGACKFVSERICIESNYSRGESGTVFVVVRYGNVLESTGSVIPYFTHKIKNGDDIPLTDERMTRFIISPQQAVELVFKAIRHGAGGEVFVPKLPAFRITDLIAILQEKHLSKNKVKVIGVRPGEKIHELMINAAEVPHTYSYQDLYVITSHLEKARGKAPYLDKNKPLTEKDLIEYSSKDAIISKDEVKRLFKELGLLD